MRALCIWYNTTRMEKVQFDGDGQHDAAYLEALIQPILDGTADYTVGSRFVQSETTDESEGFQSSSVRRAGIRFLSFLVRVLSGVKVKDVTSGIPSHVRQADFTFAF